MSWIKEVDEKKATGRLKEVYEEIKKSRGKVANILKVHSLNPNAMKNHLDLYITLMFGKSGLTREEREMVAVVVSFLNNCRYCTYHHGEALKKYLKEEKRFEEFMKEPLSTKLNERKGRMVEYATKLTKTPSKIEYKDIEKLKGVGLSDKDILDLNLIVSYFNFVNRISLGLGVELTEDETKGYKF